MSLPKSDKKVIKPIQKLRYGVNKINMIHQCLKDDQDMLVQAKFALLKTPQQRSENEYRTIEKVVGKFKYFQELRVRYSKVILFQLSQGQKIFSDFCKQLYYRAYGIGQKVIVKGEYGKQFFVLLTGSVAVIIYNPKTNEAKQQIIYQQQLLNKGSNCIPNYEDVEQFESMAIASLPAGSTFGDLALLQSNSITSATILTKEKCEFACMDKAAFWQYTGKHKQHELENKLSQLKLLPFLQFWHDNDLKTISYDFKRQVYGKGQVIIKEGDLNHGLYMIVSGEVLLSRKLNQNRDTKAHPESLDVLFIKLQKQQQQILIGVITAPQLFEDNTSQYYSVTATCLSQTCELQFISKSDLDRRLDWNPQSQKILTDISAQRSSWHVQRKENLAKTVVAKETVVLIDGKEVNVNEVKQLLNYPDYNQDSQGEPQSKVNTRISKSTDQKLNIDFMNAKGILDMDRIKDEDFKCQQFLKKPQIPNKPKNAFEKAQDLGLGTLTKTFRERQRLEKKLQKRFEINLSQALNNSVKKTQVGQVQQSKQQQVQQNVEESKEVIQFKSLEKQKVEVMDQGSKPIYPIVLEKQKESGSIESSSNNRSPLKLDFLTSVCRDGEAIRNIHQRANRQIFTQGQKKRKQSVPEDFRSICRSSSKQFRIMIKPNRLQTEPKIIGGETQLEKIVQDGFFKTPFQFNIQVRHASAPIIKEPIQQPQTNTVSSVFSHIVLIRNDNQISKESSTNSKNKKQAKLMQNVFRYSKKDIFLDFK